MKIHSRPSFFFFFRRIRYFLEHTFFSLDHIKHTHTHICDEWQEEATKCLLFFTVGLHSSCSDSCRRLSRSGNALEDVIHSGPQGLSQNLLLALSIRSSVASSSCTLLVFSADVRWFLSNYMKTFRILPTRVFWAPAHSWHRTHAKANFIW